MFVPSRALRIFNVLCLRVVHLDGDKSVLMLSPKLYYLLFSFVDVQKEIAGLLVGRDSTPSL